MTARSWASSTEKPRGRPGGEPPLIGEDLSTIAVEESERQAPRMIASGGLRPDSASAPAITALVAAPASRPGRRRGGAWLPAYGTKARGR